MSQSQTYDAQKIVRVIDAVRDAKGITRKDFCKEIKILPQTWYTYLGSKTYACNNELTLSRYAMAVGLSLSEVENIVSKVKNWDDWKASVKQIIEADQAEPDLSPDPSDADQSSQEDIPDELEGESPEEPQHKTAAIVETRWDGLQCSACKQWIPDKRYSYCPWCGLKFEK